MLVADVSFISLTLALPAAVQNQLKPGGEVVCLIKPQFEAGREAVGKGGVVRDANTHRRVIEKIIDAFSQMGLTVCGLNYSPITGADGNIEYLIYAVKGGLSGSVPDLPEIDSVIDAAWQEHKK